jgi:YidC/Oxa1 family membrane protein insertase
VSTPFAPLTDLAYQLVSGLADATTPVFGAASAAAAIVLGTVAVRVLLVPVGYAQHRAELRRTALTAKVTALRERHSRNPRKLDAELTELYRAEGGGMLLGCLPMLVQLPVFAALYQLFVSPVVHGHANLLLHQTLFGVPLGAHVLAVTAPQLFVFAGIVLLLVAVGYASARLLRPVAPLPPGAAGVLIRVLPYASAVTALFLPLAASLYLLTTTAWTVAQTLILRQL